MTSRVLRRSQWAVSSGGAAVLRADPAQLSLVAASPGPLPAAGAYGRSLSAGQYYTDPTTGVRVLKVTDALLTGNGGSGNGHGYSEGGPRVSQPWVGGDGRTYYTLFREDGWLVDLDYEKGRAGTAGALSNWRTCPGADETGIAFSLDPATPQIMYYIDTTNGTTVRRYNTATNADANIGHWPWVFAGGTGAAVWLQTQINDTWIVCMRPSTDGTMLAFRQSDGVERSLTNTRSGVAPVDEPHIDKRDPLVYIANNNSPPAWHLDTDANPVAPTDPGNVMISDHMATGKGYMMSLAKSATGGGAFYYRGDVDAVTKFIALSAGIYEGDLDQYHSGHWVMNNRGTGLLTDQWVLCTRWNNDTGAPKIRHGMMAWVNLGTGEVRTLCGHDCLGANYTQYPQSTVSPDGKLVVWTSDMNLASGTTTTRIDIFCAFTPVS